MGEMQPGGLKTIASIALGLFAALPAPARAACAPGAETVLSCTLKDATRALDVCIDGAAVTYAFGRPGQSPELALSELIGEIRHQPWPGFGRTIWENVTFVSGAYGYEVYVAVDKIDQVPLGGVTVTRDGAEIARLDCDAGSAEIGLWALGDAKQAVGLCWRAEAEIWAACP